MKLYYILAGIIVLGLLIWGWFLYSQSSLEQPRYTVTQQQETYQIRRYEPMLQATAPANAAGFQNGLSRGFMKVAGYIFGGNNSNTGSKKINMTVPVFDTKSEQNRTVSFFVPKQWTKETLPVPNSDEVTIVEVPEKTYAVMTFSGFWTEEKAKEGTKALRSELEKDGIETVGEPVFAYYNPPSMPPFLRRNEVLLEVLTAQVDMAEIPETAAVATLAGGCFWCIETAFESMEGVYASVSGYAGGDKSDASYRLVSSGETAHREAVQVHFNPEVVSYPEILDTFWRQIDPTDDGGQFADRGYHYTTAIYPHDEKQQEQAELSVSMLKESGKFDAPIATKIEAFTTFFPAEEYHQNFAQKRSAYYQQYKKGSGRAGYIEQTWED